MWVGAGQILKRIGGGSDEDIADAEVEELLKQKLAESSVRMYSAVFLCRCLIEACMPPFFTSLL